MKNKIVATLATLVLATAFANLFESAANATPESDETKNRLDGISHAGWEPVKTVIYSAAPVTLTPDTTGSAAKYAQTINDVKEGAPTTSFMLRDTKVLEELHCQVLAQKTFKRGNRYITIEEYLFDNPMYASAAFGLLHTGSANVVKRGDGSSEDEKSISFWQDRHFFRLASTEPDDEESKDVMNKMYKQMSAIVAIHSDSPRFAQYLPQIERVRGSERLVVGPLTSKHYFDLPFLEKLSIDKARIAALADYQVQYPNRERLRVLVINHENPLTAQAGYKSFVDELTALHEADFVKEGPNPQALFKINKTYLFLGFKEPNKLVLIYGARKRSSSSQLACQI
ncbi:hypothetical protein KA183_11830 [bacterium]|nr:hypothetical protein [bacterium]QQR57062.1 MAG: hypothetical protein IPG59_19055 [Candidatus Melainabacteria bacterium]